MNEYNISRKKNRYLFAKEDEVLLFCKNSLKEHVEKKDLPDVVFVFPKA